MNAWEKIRKWLSTLEYRSTHDNIYERREPNTGMVVREPELQGLDRAGASGIDTVAAWHAYVYVSDSNGNF